MEKRYYIFRCYSPFGRQHSFEITIQKGNENGYLTEAIAEGYLEELLDGSESYSNPIKYIHTILPVYKLKK